MRKQGKVTNKCAWCGKEFTVYYCQSHQKFCSRECSNHLWELRRGQAEKKKPEPIIDTTPKKPLYANEEIGFVREYIGKVITI